MTTYLVRHRGISHICRPGAITCEMRSEGDPEGYHEKRLRLGWFTRDESALVCHDGEEDSVTALDDDEPESPEVLRLRRELERARGELRSARSITAQTTAGGPSGPGWEPWAPSPGAMPVGPDVAVDVIMRNGESVYGRKASWHSWAPQENSAHDIVWWRTAG